MKSTRGSVLAAYGVVALLAALVLMAAFPRAGFGQVNPLRFGTWKLDVAKSKYSPGLPPKNLVRKDERAGEGLKATVEGVDGNGNRIAYTYTVNYDGKDYRITGTGTPNGAETIAIRRVDAYTTEATLRRAGRVVLTTRSEVSKDGRLLIITGKGTNVSGEPTTARVVYQRQ